MRNCFIPGCDRLCRINGTVKRRMFVVPKDKRAFDAWVKVLPNQRELKAHDKVCERHFKEDDICTTYDNHINGMLVKMERGRAKLKPFVVPSENLEVDLTKRKSTLAPGEMKKFKVVDVASLIIGNVGIEEHDQQEEQHVQQLEIEEDVEEISIPINEVKQQTDALPRQEVVYVVHDGQENTENAHQEQPVEEDKVQKLFETLYENIFEVTLPNTLWGIHRCPKQTAIFFSYVDPNQLRTTKMVSIMLDGKIKVLFGHRLMSEQNLVTHIASVESLSEMINEVDEVQLCPKMFENDLCEIAVKDNESEFCEACMRFEYND